MNPGAIAVVEPVAERAWLRKLLSFLLPAAGLLLLLRLTPLRDLVDQDALRDLATRLGPWGPPAIAAVGVASPLIFLPRWPIALVAGMLYGLGWGSLLANTASTLGAWLHFLLARGLLHPSAERLRRRYKLTDLGQQPERVLFWGLFLLRAFPLSNFVVTNLLAGAVRLRLRTYLAATFLGMIPSTLMYAAVGGAVLTPDDPTLLRLALALLTILSLGAWLTARKLKAHACKFEP